MSDPVDTDALNTDRLRAVASTLHSKAFHLMNAAADEVDRLRAALENAPHDEPRDGDDGYGCQININGACNCWKADV